VSLYGFPMFITLNDIRNFSSSFTSENLFCWCNRCSTTFNE